MLKNYIKITIRSLRNNVVTTAINIIGLSLGMAAFILIFQYISFEKSVDSFHKELPNLYRIVTETKEGEVWDDTAPGFAPICKQQIPEIQDYCRIAIGTSLGDGVLGVGDTPEKMQSFRERNFVYAEGNFFQLFSFPITDGKAESLKSPNTVALSTSTAKKYFGSQNALGKVITLNNQFGKSIYTVVLVFADMPQNSDFVYDAIFSIHTLESKANLNGNEDWASLDGVKSQWLKTYLLLQPSISADVVGDKAMAIKRKINPENTDMLQLQPLAHQHLAKSLSDRMPTTGSLGFIYLLTGISILIIAIAWFNYVNLTTAASLKRAKEVGIRKVSGATKFQLVYQFLGESFTLNIIALLVAFTLVTLLQAMFNGFLGKDLSIAIFLSGNSWLMVAAILIVGSVASGAYTAFALSSFEPSQTLKGVFSKSQSGIGLRKGLVVFQFTISIALIACTLLLQRQLAYLRNENLGMDISRLIVINGPEVGKDESFKGRSSGFENELNQLGYIQAYCRSGNVPIDGYNFSEAGITKQNPSPNDDKLGYSMLTIDHRYLKTYSIELVAGKSFTEEMTNVAWNDISKIMVNEKAAKQLGFNFNEAAIDEKVLWEDKNYEVIGVVRDYHHLSLRQGIDPIIFIPRNNGGAYSVKITSNDIASHLSELDAIFKKYFPGNPFDYYFSNQKYAQLYQTEQQYGTLFTIASGLAIFLACLGLFGLATFTVEQRIKEIGIRKVLGARVPQIIALIAKEFLVLVSIAILIATPISWYGMGQWLQGFAYQTEMKWWIFVIAGLVTMLVTLATVSSRAIKAAMSDPVKSLRSE